ncbi:hypothetical protein HanPSC8_Chr02g0080841 [Helianthus annuus]|nr:hypothetical protein HanPSC8_Chr02g0080841 [Helianthus annuus]
MKSTSPFSMTLMTFSFQTFNCHHKSGTGFRRSKSGFINPPFIHPAKPAFSDETIRPEILCSSLQITQRERLQVITYSLTVWKKHEQHLQVFRHRDPFDD